MAKKCPELVVQQSFKSNFCFKTVFKKVLFTIQSTLLIYAIFSFFIYQKFHVMLPPHAMDMEPAKIMEIVNVTTVFTQLIVQVNFLCSVRDK